VTIEQSPQSCGRRGGEHCCLIYESATDQLAAIVPLLKDGLDRKECCVAIADDQTLAEVAGTLSASGVNVPREPEALLLLPTRDTYLRSGALGPEAMIDFLRQIMTRALNAGFSGLRVLGDMNWALGPGSGCARLIEYEALLHDFFSENPISAVCQYDRCRFSPEGIDQILRTHPVVFLGGQACPNPFFEPPRMVLGQMSPWEQVDWKITQLKRARAAEQTVLEKHSLLRSVVEGTADAVFVKDQQGRYLMINTAGARVLGKSVEEVVGKNDMELLTPETALPIMEDDRTIMATGETQTHERGVTAAGVTRTYLATRGPYRDPEGNVVGVVGIAHDITDRKTAEEAFRKSEERFRRYFELGLIGMAITSPTKRCLEVNDETCRILGYSRDELLQKAWTEITHPDDLAADVAQFNRVLAGEIDGYTMDKRFVRKDGRVIDTTISVKCLRNEDGVVDYFVALLLDITERKRAEDSLKKYASRFRAFSHRLVEVQEQERHHLARELHDEIGQILTSLKFALEASAAAPPATAAGKLGEARALVEESLNRVRELSFDLRPTLLDHLGLLPALRGLIERYTANTGVRVNFHHVGLDRRFRPELETAAYRIVQEALTNVARHARVREVEVRLWVDAETLRVQVEDHGVGFDREAVLAAGRSAGLPGMHERVMLLGGQLSVESTPGGGAHLLAELPLGGHAGRRS
jgi:PAS domain S-box-containing protein